MARKKTILFVGAFLAVAGGVVGGQLVACRLLVNSPLAQAINLRLLDTTMKSLPPPGFFIRAWYAAERLVKVIGQVIFGRIDGMYVFSPLAASGFFDRGLMCLAGRMFRKRVVLSLRSEVRPIERLPWLSRRFARLVLRCCDAIHCQSSIAAETLTRFYDCDPARIVVIPNWIDAGKYAKAADEHARRSSRTRPVVLFTGWLAITKGAIDLADAARRLVERGLDFRLVLCGSGIHHDEMVRRCRENGLNDRVEFRGWVDENQKREALAEADLFVFPSHREGMPNSVIEAMAAGLPIVATPVGGIPCMVESGRNGLLVPVSDPEKLADAIEKLLRDEPLRRKMGLANRRQIEEQQDLARIWPRVAAMLTGEPC
jgi:glycosyltransferase involved in cell wall biosynthesis